jgi:hypothetical protein
VRFTACPGLNVTGNVAPEAEKPVPVTAAEFTVTAAPPVDDRVTVCVVGVLSAVLPNETLVALMLRTGAAVFNWSAKLIDTVPVVAVSDAVCAVLTDDTVALNPALVAEAGTVTEAGTETALLLLARPTATPPVGAEPVRVTVHASVPAPVIEALLQ